MTSTPIKEIPPKDFVKPPQMAAFLRLPLETRLNIYSLCNLSTLLQLSLTCSHLHEEINTDPNVIQLLLQHFNKIFEVQRNTTISDFSLGPPPCQTAAIFSLPVEIRLEIYSRCPSAFTLLQLSHTSSALHHEINEYPGLFASVFGYKNHANLITGQKSLCISSIERLKLWEEYELFQKMYCAGRPNAPAYTCPDCLYIRRFNERAKSMSRRRARILRSIGIASMRNVCFGCMMEIDGYPFNPPDIIEQWINGV